MGLFDKIKDILFVEDEELPVMTKETKQENIVKEEVKRSEIPTRQTPIKRDIEVIPQEETVEVPKVELPKREPVKNQSPFFSFDEDEFERLNNKVNSKKEEELPQRNLVRTTTTTKKTEYKDYSRYEVKKVIEKQPFKASPVISPVYGILDKNYKKTDVIERSKTEETPLKNFETIRNKAFGDEVDILEFDEPIIEPTANQVVEEEIKKPKIKITKPKEEKSIDELLLEGFETKLEEDLVTKVKAAEDTEIDYKYVDEHTSALEILDEIEKELNKQEGPKVKKESLEGDLFNLIDTMYENREEEE